MSPLCKICPQTSPKQILNHSNFSPFCKAFNVIYKITHKLCGLIYIAETSTPLNFKIIQNQARARYFKRVVDIGC